MDDVWSWAYRIFVHDAQQAFVPVLLLLTIGSFSLMIPSRPVRSSIWSLGGAAILWFLYALWEMASHTSGEIRFDLMLIYPMLFYATVIAALHWFIAIIWGVFQRNKNKAGSSS